MQGKQLTLDKLTPGVQCAHCHQGIDAHLAAVWPAITTGAANRPAQADRTLGRTGFQLLRPMSPDLGGDCAARKLRALPNIRFQPYRLTGSKCYDPDDARISCLTCHNPHQDFDNPQTVDFDPQVPGMPREGENRAPKPVRSPKTSACTCHMPKIDCRGPTTNSTDHRIRIVKPNEPYPG